MTFLKIGNEYINADQVLHVTDHGDGTATVMASRASHKAIGDDAKAVLTFVEHLRWKMPEPEAAKSTTPAKTDASFEDAPPKFGRK